MSIRISNRIKAIMIDNQDSFTFNLVDALKTLGCELKVYQNYVAYEVIEQQVKAGEVDLLMLSPGPGNPDDAGVCRELVKGLQGQCVIAGICLGHQVIIDAFGGEVGQFTPVMHGKSSNLSHTESGLFTGISSPTKVARYHSLSAQDVPAPLSSTATLAGVSMAIEAPSLGIYGMQFHPESILTPQGMKMLTNLINLTQAFKQH